MEAAELNCIRITNSSYAFFLGPFVKAFLERVPMEGITYESLVTFLSSTIQHGEHCTQMNMRAGAEFWVVFEGPVEENNPIAFAHWHVKTIPSIGTVRCDYIYSWNRKKDPVRLLVKELLAFAIDHRCTKIDATLTNEAVYRVFEKVANDLGLKINREETINVLVQR